MFYEPHSFLSHKLLTHWALVFLCLTILTPDTSFAQSENQEKSEIADYCTAMKAGSDCIKKECIQDGKNLCTEQYRFIPYQPNSAVYQYTEHDDNSIEVNYSFRYLISKPDCTNEPKKDCLDNYQNRWEHFFTYTGKFDFYLGTKPSDPVINRLNNPAWHSRRYLHNSTYVKWIDFGIEHKSNGQVVSGNEVIPGTTQNKAASEYLSKNYQYIDSISRSANYLSLETRSDFSFGFCNQCDLWLKLFTLHFKEESDVYWGKYAGRNISFGDFERLRTIINIPLNHPPRRDLRQELAVEWTIGDMGLGTDSANISLKWPIQFSWGTLPLLIRAHSGPMNELSNYSESQKSIGIGLAFFH